MLFGFYKHHTRNYMELLSQLNGINIIARLISKRDIIPIFGAGFSMNSKAYKGVVPDGKCATEKMKELIVKHRSEISEDDVKNLDFNKTSELFIELVPKEIRTEFFKNYFTEVSIGTQQKEFLEINWPYAYTLNIDDAIENTTCFKPVLPYKNLNAPNTSIKLLYKLHGDAATEVTYLTDENIVFSHKQYIQSITAKENQDFLRNLRSDFSTNNMIFIGCSLFNEPDLKYVYGKAEHSSSTLKILLREKKPTFLEEVGLQDYGINTIVLIEDYSYFYQQLIKEVRRLAAEEDLVNYKFKSPVVTTMNNKSDAIHLLSGNPIFDEKENLFYKGGMHVLRDCIEEVEEQLKINNCVIVKGRRFSGKTFLLCSLCERQKRNTIYFFPSTTFVDEELLCLLLNKENNSYFIFDSNSISNGCYRLLVNSYNLLKKNSNKLIIAVNSNDNYIMESLQATFVEIQSTFQEQELQQNIDKANSYGLIRRYLNNTNMDYLEMLSQKQKIDIPNLNIFPKMLSLNEKILLLLLTASDKIYMSDIMALGIPLFDVEVFKKSFPLIIEEVLVDINEKTNYSSTKLVHNSKVVLMKLLDRIDREEIIECIIHIVEMVKNDRTRYRIYIDIILFDTLNQLFGGKKGAGHLIFEVYEKLEPYLCDSLHYWLQRAKSIYWLFFSDSTKLKEAYSYSAKVYFDGGYSIKPKAALTSSLISCLISNLEKDIGEKQYYLEHAIEFGYEAVNSDYYRFNKGYLNNELKPRKRMNSCELMKNICNEYIEYYCATDTLEKAKKLIDKLEDMQKSFVKTK